MEILVLKKYNHAMQQIANLADALFTTKAELEMAQVEIAELKARLKEKYEPAEPKD